MWQVEGMFAACRTVFWLPFKNRLAISYSQAHSAGVVLENICMYPLRLRAMKVVTTGRVAMASAETLSERAHSLD